MNIMKFIAGTTLLTTSALSVVSVVNETVPIVEDHKAASIAVMKCEFVNEPLVSFKGEYDSEHREELNNRAGW